MQRIKKSKKLHGVCYDIRGRVSKQARQLEDEGHDVLKLNIGNPAAFGFTAPDDIIKDVIHNLPQAQGYSEANGIYSARVAVMQYYQQQGIDNVAVNDIYIGNGVSELIVMAMQGLLDGGDQILVPAPDYPLWTAAINLSGGKAVHYICDEQSDWIPDLDDIKAKISSHTRGIVLINPNNPTGAVYPEAFLIQLLELARAHNLIIFSDEIYDKILYDGAKHTSIATLADDVLCLTFGGLSKNYRIAGFRAGWLVLSGPKYLADEYIEALDMLSSMRLCANVPCQYAIQTALGGRQSIDALVQPGGRLYQQMDLSWRLLNDIPGISCTRPKGAMYLFPKIDSKRFNIHNDEQFVLDLLNEKKILLIHGRGFNYHQPDHFRLVFLPHAEVLGKAIDSIGHFLQSYSQ